MAKRRFRQRLHALRTSRAAGMLGKLPIGPMVESGGVGALFGVVEDAANLDFIKNNWYGGPVAGGALALLIGKKRPTSAHALAGAAGYEARFNYMLRKFQLGESNKSPVRWFGKPQTPAAGAPAAAPAATNELTDYDTGTPQAQSSREFLPLAPLPSFEALEQETIEAGSPDDGGGGEEGDISSALALHSRSLFGGGI
jgi:hypothetical protein